MYKQRFWRAFIEPSADEIKKYEAFFRFLTFASDKVCSGRNAEILKRRKELEAYSRVHNIYHRQLYCR